MTDAQRTRGLVDRWPTALALVGAAGAIAVIALLDRDLEIFGPVVVTMAGIYLMAYALGPPATVWIALFVLSAATSALQVLDDALPVDAAVSMTILVVVLWLWTVLRRRYTDRPTFSLQTAGMVFFGAVTLACTAVAPRWGLALAGLGFLAHGAWDAYHFRVNKVVHRTYAEFCAVVDFVIGPALIIAALVQR